MNNKIKIVQIEEKHIESFHACLDSVAKEEKYLARLEAPSLDSVIAFVKKKIDSGITHLVALDGETVIGWCDIHPLSIKEFSHSGVLGMGVLKNYRGKGHGRRLLEKAIFHAKESGLEKVELEVFSDNQPAIDLYTKAGFVKEGLKRKSRKLKGEYYDLLCMALIF